jgi:hypothetical protein
MPKQDGTGPEGKGSRTGRKLGKCRKENSGDNTGSPGKGMGLRRMAGGGEGQGKRNKSN